MTSEELKSYYQQRIDVDNQLFNEIKRKIHIVGSLRLVIVLSAVALIYLWWGNTLNVVTTIFVAFVALLFLIKKHGRMFARKEFYATSMQANQSELAAIDYDFSSFDGAKEQINGTHFFSHDIDLFGEKSLFQSLNRTVTPHGKQTLINWLEHPLKEKTTILNRQAAIRELQQQQDLRQMFRVFGLLSSNNPDDMKELNSFAKEAPCLLQQRNKWLILSWIYPAFWTISIILVACNVWSPALFGLAIPALWALSETQSKKINKLQESLVRKMKVFASYSDQIRLIEDNQTSCDLLTTVKERCMKEGKKSSVLIRELSYYLSNLEQRSSGLGWLILNTLLLWDIRYALKIEKWRESNGTDLIQWMEALGEYDALCSLATFAFNHDSYTFPTITDTYFGLQAKDLGHPLMHRDACVKNDINISKAPFFMIVTGANMAGKSTYLRTIGVNYLLASVGAPVCASSFTFYPAQLVTSLRTSDSLTDNESYFFAELKRLKMIIDRLKNGEQLFIILDEILKGTNSIDKQKGSLALMKQLVLIKACGIIATHDLALGDLINDFPENIRNYRFEADIQGNELTFSYSLQPGVAKNMNACFLMKKMGITVD